MAYMKDSTGRRLDRFRAAPALTPVADRPIFPGAPSASGGLSNGTDMQAVYKTNHVIKKDATNLALVYVNYYDLAGIETDGPNAITVSAYVERSGVLYPVYFNGARSVTIDPGGTVIGTIGLHFVAGTTILVRSYVRVATSGQKWWLGPLTAGAVSEGVVRSATTVDPVGTIPNVSNERAFGPSAILSTGDVEAGFLVNGDSIAAGFDDDSNRSIGFIGRALSAAGHGYVTVAMGSQGLTAWTTPAQSQRRMPLLDYATVVIDEMGINSIAAGLATMKTLNIQTWRLWERAGKRVWRTTLTPYTTSTDSWATTANQTVTANEANRVGFNDWVRDGAPINIADDTAAAIGATGAGVSRAGDDAHPLEGYFEIADIAESARNSGKWKVSGAANYATDDGVHPSPALHELLAAGIDVPRMVA